MKTLSLKTFHNYELQLNHLQQMKEKQCDKYKRDLYDLLVAHWSWAPIIFTFIDFCISITKLYSDIALQFILETRRLSPGAVAEGEGRP